MINETTDPTTATIYVTAGQDSHKGPFGWVARTITSEGFSELRGHDKGPFARLYIVGTIAALDALPEGSTVRLVSSDEYLIRWVIDRIDALVAGKVKTKGKTKPLANKELFPEVLRARDRHAQVTTQIVPAAKRDAEHDEAMASLGRLLDAVKLVGDEGEPMPVHKARKAEPQVKPDDAELNEGKAMPSQAEVDQVTPSAISQGAALDVPW